MQRFELRSGSDLRATTRQKAYSLILCKQDPSRSSNKLYDYGERAFGGGLRTREVPAVHLGSKIVIYTNHAALKYFDGELFQKYEHKGSM